MGYRVADKIAERSGRIDLLESLKALSPSELNSLMLEVYRTTAEDMTPAQLLKSYDRNRFVKPAGMSPLKMLRLELEVYEIAESRCYIPIELSPVAPLGACSAMAKVSQNKILSAIRGTEVMADATNSLALHICAMIKTGEASRKANELIRYCTSHRHVRAQPIKVQGFSPHFKAFGMVASGRDAGSFGFEKRALLEQLEIYAEICERLFGVGMKIVLFESGGYSIKLPDKLASYLEDHLADKAAISISPEPRDTDYYIGTRFKAYAMRGNKEIEIADGGFVDWSQRLLENKKERMLISGLGLDYILNAIGRI